MKKIVLILIMISLQSLSYAVSDLDQHDSPMNQSNCDEPLDRLMVEANEANMRYEKYKNLFETVVQTAGEREKNLYLRKRNEAVALLQSLMNQLEPLLKQCGLR